MDEKKIIYKSIDEQLAEEEAKERTAATAKQTVKADARSSGKAVARTSTGPGRKRKSRDIVTETERARIEYQVANEFTVSLISTISKKYGISESKVLDIFDKTKYWDVINNDRVCCVVAHDGVNYVINRLEGDINEILSQDRQ